jgi:proteasome lid subunit RPN8/RPN11
MDMQFGELEQSGPQPQLRPDRNKHFAVAACGKPAEEDLSIFVDMDVMRDMQRHAHRDTGVELGGVMLGGHFEDEQGRPFVMVQDSLRAEHYESTKGSFKFTHETWEQITRERDQFPSDMAMVGWYHTHPDWGVFLSGMDMFICDHFFNKPLDVALVIDPCRRDLGWFQWTGEPGERIRRTGGYYLVSSRFRRAELRHYAAILDRKMSHDPRSELWDPAHGSTPVVHVHQSRSWIQDVAVLSMLMVQFFVLALIAWRILLPAGDPGAPADRLEARREVVEEVLARMDVDAPRLVSSLEQTRQENAALQLDKTALAALARRLESQRDEAAQRNVWLEG